MTDRVREHPRHEELAQTLMGIHRETYGVGASRASAYVLDDAVLCFLEDIELLPNERFLISEGYEVDVLETRHRYQRAVRPSFIAAVERYIGRKVVHFSSDTSLDPPMSMELFVLGPET